MIGTFFDERQFLMVHDPETRILPVVINIGNYSAVIIKTQQKIIACSGLNDIRATTRVHPGFFQLPAPQDLFIVRGCVETFLTFKCQERKGKAYIQQFVHTNDLLN